VVYIVQCRDNTFYTGITNDLLNRVKAHNSGAGAKYTKGRVPVKVVFTQSCKDRSDASKREREIKRLNKASKIALINKCIV